MGLLSSIGSKVVSVAKSVGSKVVSVAKSVRSKLASNISKANSLPPKPMTLSSEIPSPAGIAKAVAKAGLPIAKSVGSKIGSAIVSTAKALIPKTTKGKILGALAVPVVVGAISAQPKELGSKLMSAPGQLSTFGKDIANFAVNPSLESGKKIIEDSPIITSILGVASVIGLVKALPTGTIQALAVGEQTEAMRERTRAEERERTRTEERERTRAEEKYWELKEKYDNQPTVGPITPYVPKQEKEKKSKDKSSVAPTTPVLPLTKDVSTSKRKHRSKVKKQASGISQRVSINIGNKSFIRHQDIN